MKYLVNILLILFVSGMFGAQAQTGNEWINTSQKYYRLSITQTGIHRISKSQLLSNVPDIDNYNIQQIQLFFKGEEIPCYIKGENNGDIEYIEFYAEQNDGWFDINMYNNPENQLNPYYSLINDTASVFITWNESLNNKRYKVTNSQTFDGFTPISYCFNNTISQYTSSYYIGSINPANCQYNVAEGWVDNQSIKKGKSITKSIATPNVYSMGPDATIEYALLTYSKDQHHLTAVGAGVSFDTAFIGLTNIKKTHQVNAGNLQETNDLVFSSVDDHLSEADNSALSYIRIKYPMTFDFQGKSKQEFTIPASATQQSFIEITNFNTNGNIYLYNITSQQIIHPTIENETIKALIPASEVETRLILLNEEAINAIEKISQTKFINHNAGNKSFVIVTHQSLLETVNENYKTYRDAYVVDVDNLYDQFGYGIQKHPLAIRNFVTYIQNQWDIKPEFLFLIGKGVAAYVDNYYPGYRTSTTSYKNCLVPPMGYPFSDVLLAIKTDGSSLIPSLSVGRLSAQTPKQVNDYLSKVQEFEANEPAEWMKRAIHFGGGDNASDQSNFSNYLSNYEKSFEDTLFGGSVSTFLKTSSDPIEITQSDSVELLLNGGVSIMTFFGHGTTSGFDQNIDDPSAFLNFEKYPLLIANSCYSGNIFMPGQFSNSEKWILIPNKGVIGYLAVTNQGIAPYLNRFTEEFYKNLSINLYGEPIGKIIQTTRKTVYDKYMGNATLNALQEFTLHGDPAIVLNSFEKPDLIIEENSISFSPTILSTQVDSFNINILLKNIARAATDTFWVYVSRTFPDGSVNDTQLVVNGLNYKTTLSIKLATDIVKGKGINSFYISVDASNVINELSEINNTVTITSLILSNEIIAAVPYKYSLIPESPESLKALTGNPLETESTSTFQIDTTHLFNSPFLLSQDINQSGGVIEWQPGINFTENQIYYWRAGKNSSKSETVWSTSSFCFQNNKTGWIQSDFGQFIDDGYSLIKANSTTKKFDFITTPKRLSCHNVGSPWEATYKYIKFSIDDLNDYSSCTDGAALLLVVIDTIDLQPWKSDRNELFGNSNYPRCDSRGREDLYFVFPADETGRWNMINTVNNYVPDGFHVLIYSFGKIPYHTWSYATIEEMKVWGAQNIGFLADHIPYIFYVQKGDLSTAEEVFGTSATEEIDFSTDISTNFVYGNIASTIIGPSKNWGTINWEAQPVEINPNEIYHLSVSGINQSGAKTLLMDSITNTSVDISNISSTQYPYLQLKFYTKDLEFKTPTQLKKWSVEYTPITDLAINPLKGFEFYSDTLARGEKGSLSVAIENIGPTSSDSILVEYWLLNAQNKNIPLTTHRIQPLETGQFVVDTVSFETINFSGLISIWANINPIIATTNDYDQQEQNHYNNIVSKYFYVQNDQTNPLLDVTFDGMHIMDGDIVSARPEIIIQLQDENEYIVLNDTSTFSIYLKSQQTGIEEKIPVTGNAQIIFIAGELPKNKAQLIYEPELNDDGTYELRVRAKDASGNESGTNDYQITFQVINESTITNVFNYPNPFSTSTRFVFELTGSEVPDEIRIDILTVTGRVVKTIYQSDLGILNIGKNITDYAWDGRDNYGDPLANGVYFYKVSVRLNGKELKHRDTGTSKYFKNGIGKMYIMR